MSYKYWYPKFFLCHPLKTTNIKHLSPCILKELLKLHQSLAQELVIIASKSPLYQSNSVQFLTLVHCFQTTQDGKPKFLASFSICSKSLVNRDVTDENPSAAHALNHRLWETASMPAWGTHTQTAYKSKLATSKRVWSNFKLLLASMLDKTPLLFIILTRQVPLGVRRTI